MVMPIVPRNKTAKKIEIHKLAKQAQSTLNESISCRAIKDAILKQFNS